MSSTFRLAWPRGGLRTYHNEQWGNDRNSWRLNGPLETAFSFPLLYVNPVNNVTEYLEKAVIGWTGEPSAQIGASWWVVPTPGPMNSSYGSWSEDLNMFVTTSFSFFGNFVHCSLDGVTWRLFSGAAASLQDAKWSRELGLLVAVGSSGQVAVSTDLETSTLVTAPTGTWRAVAWSAEVGLFVVHGQGTSYITSPDGFNWTARTSAVALGGWALQWNRELSLFFSPGQRIATSPDGINWTHQGPDQAVITYGLLAWSPTENLLIAANVSSSTTGNLDLMRSTDGINWTPYTIPAVGMGDAASTGPRIKGILWLSKINLFMLLVEQSYVSGTPSYIFTSPNGFDWTARPSRGGSVTSIMWSPTLNLLAMTSNASTFGGANARIFLSGTL